MVRRSTVVAALALAACSRPGPVVGEREAPNLLASKACDARQQCACADEAACTQRIRDDIEAAGVQARRFGLRYHGGCAQEWVAALEAGRCESIEACEMPCPIYQGTRPLDEPCRDWAPWMSDCGPDLRCVAGICVEMECGATMDTGTTGEELCETPCAPGERCHAGRCERPAAEAESCDDLPCESDLFCNADFLCEARKPDGAACSGHDECRSNACPVGSCTAAGTVGMECDSARPCAADLDCVEGRCAQASPQVCSL